MAIKLNMKKAANKSIDAENKAGSRVLLAQHPRPSLISGHDWRSARLRRAERGAHFVRSLSGALRRNRPLHQVWLAVRRLRLLPSSQIGERRVNPIENLISRLSRYFLSDS